MNPNEPPPAEDAICARKGKDGNEHMERNGYADAKGCEEPEVQRVFFSAAKRIGLQLQRTALTANAAP